MSGEAINQFSGYQVFPKYVAEETLKRARTTDDNGQTSIRVTATNPEPTPVDLSTLESNTGDIKTYSQAINDKVGFKTDVAWDGETTNPSMISLLKKTASNTVDLSEVTTSLGTTSDVATDSTVIGLLKRVDADLPAATDLSGITTPLGTTSDASTDSTVIGLLKSIASRLQ